MKKITTVSLCALLFGFIAQISAQNIQATIDQQIDQLLENSTISPRDTNWKITSEHTSRTSGITHVYFRQVLNGLEVLGSESSVHVYSNGEVLKSNLSFINSYGQEGIATNTPAINAVQAVSYAAAKYGYSITEGISVISSKNQTSQESLLSTGGISMSAIPAKLMYQANENDDLVLIWDVSIEEVAQENWWNTRIDAITGEIVSEVNWMTSCSFEHDHNTHSEYDYNKNLYDIPNYDAKVANSNMYGTSASGALANSYEVFPIPVESPYYTTPMGTRTIVTDPANVTASPFGWHDTDGVSGPDSDLTTGNNADAYDDGDNPGYRADGGPTQDFVGFPFDMNYSNATPYEDAALTNLFYWTNIIHDVTYMYGFDEASGNFQENNYGNGGLGGDYVRSEAQDGSGTCNANFATPPDGSLPRMQMYVCGDKDGDFDNLVIVHEYGHGISNRLTGGGAVTGCLGNSEQMGEGWSDFYGVIMTIEPGDTGTDNRGVGTYLFDQGINGPGIRPFPYNTDIAQNPQTYDDIKTSAVPHGVGSVWCTTLWEVTWELIDDHGFDTDIYNFTGDVNLDAGNVQAFALVTEAMKLQPCSPGFVDGRDAIFAADQALYGGANECSLWDAFAKRGLGVSASQGTSGSVQDGTEAFDTPSGAANLDTFDDTCLSTAPITDAGGGSPSGGVYSGPGVTDNGDGQTYTFDPAVAGVGTHTIMYDVPASACAPAGSATDTVEVLSVPPSPSTTGASGFCIGDSVTVTASLAVPANVISWFDAETGGNFLFEGTSYTYTPTGSESVWAQERPPGPLSQLKISEVTMQTPDQIEIQNIGASADYTGYVVASSEEPYTDINTINPNTQTLGVMGADSAIFWDDSVGSPNYWGSNLWWNDGAGNTGWVIIIDDSGNVVDSIFWNVDAATLATLNVTINGFNITAADLDWTGPGATLTSSCGGTSYRRVGDADDASDWANVCSSSDFGTANDDIDIGPVGCLSVRAEATVVAETEAPTVTCPADMTEIIPSGTTFSVPDYTGGVTATDNCAGAPTLTQDPAVGTALGDGVYTVTVTATDAAGNEGECTFTLTIDEVLALEDNALSNLVSLYPNPTSGELTLLNTSSETLTEITISDVNGRIVSTLPIENIGTTTTFSLSQMASGMYFIKIDSENASAVKRIIKE